MSSPGKLKSILIIIDYFGQWPPWFPLFLESCRANPTINWLFHTDCSFEQFDVPNVEFRYITYGDFVDKVSERLRVRFTPKGSYKLCDIRPMYGIIHEEEIAGFDFYGYGDLDVIYGNIRNFYTDDVLKSNVISAHGWCISGHLALFKNVAWIRNVFRRCPLWKAIVEDPEPRRFDEDIFSRIFQYPRSARKFPILYDLMHPSSMRYRRRSYLVEQYTTPMTPAEWRGDKEVHPEVWYWKDGLLTNEIRSDGEFIYLHFMNYISGRWMAPQYMVHPCWKQLGDYIFVTAEEMRAGGIRIDRSGFHVLDR